VTGQALNLEWSLDHDSNPPPLPFRVDVAFSVNRLNLNANAAMQGGAQPSPLTPTSASLDEKLRFWKVGLDGEGSVSVGHACQPTCVDCHLCFTLTQIHACAGRAPL